MNLKDKLKQIAEKYINNQDEQDTFAANLLEAYDRFKSECQNPIITCYPYAGRGPKKQPEHVTIAYTFLITSIAIDFLRITNNNPIRGFDRNNPYEGHTFMKLLAEIFEILAIKGPRPHMLVRRFIRDINSPTYRYKPLQCASCRGLNIIKNGLTKAGKQKYKCNNCGRHVLKEKNKNFHGTIDDYHAEIEHAGLPTRNTEYIVFQD